MQFAWTFPQFIVNPSTDGLTNVVTAINWVCTGTDGAYTSSESGSVKLGTPNPAEFIPYADITQEMAYMWVSQGISMPGVENQISSQVTQLSQSVLQTQSPPFS
jgi:hypothetical protein